MSLQGEPRSKREEGGSEEEPGDDEGHAGRVSWNGGGLDLGLAPMLQGREPAQRLQRRRGQGLGRAHEMDTTKPGPFHVMLSPAQVAEALTDYCEKHALVPDGRYTTKVETATIDNVILRVELTFTRAFADGAA